MYKLSHENIFSSLLPKIFDNFSNSYFNHDHDYLVFFTFNQNIKSVSLDIK